MAKGNKLVTGITTEEWDILLKVINDPFYFSQFVKISHATRGKIPFILFPYQKACLYEFLNHRFNIVLKFRQAGLTELISMYCLWLAMFHNTKNILIISLKDRVAKKVLRKIKYMYKNLPDFMKVEIVNGRSGEFGTATEMEFANGSSITSIPTTEDAGRSEAVSLLVMDEAAIMKWAGKIFESAFPTLSTGGRAIINSTPYGVGNFYHNLWVNAVSGGNDFNAIRLKWQMHPERYRFPNDMDWYHQQRSIMGARKTAQEIDGDFLTSGASVFDLLDIREIGDYIQELFSVDSELAEEEGLNIQMEDKGGGKLIKFRDAKPGEQCFIGADVSTGRSRDYSTFSVMNRQGEELACFRGKISVDKFADKLMSTGRTFNNALIAPESNDIGLAVTTKIQNAGYDNLYYSVALVRKKKKKKPEEKEIPGWLTTTQNRPVIIDALEEAVRNDEITIRDPFFVDEAYTFIYDDKNKAVALGKDKKSGGDEDEDEIQYTDDTILAKAIANHIRKGKYKSKVSVLPQTG